VKEGRRCTRHQSSDSPPRYRREIGGRAIYVLSTECHGGADIHTAASAGLHARADGYSLK